MATVKATQERLRNTRDIAMRLNLGACSQCDYLRSVVVELLSDLIGDDVRHASLELSGAMHPPPTLMQAAAPTLGPQSPKPVVAPFAAAAPPQRALTIEQAKKIADARARLGQSTPIGATATKPNTPAEMAVPIGRIVPIRKTAAELAAEHPAAAEQANPDPTVPDPAGESFLGNLAADLDGEAENEGQAG
jgi:hypothetical protein